MADNFGLKIGLEGEKEFKNALRDINQSFKVLGSGCVVVNDHRHILVLFFVAGLVNADIHQPVEPIGDGLFQFFIYTLADLPNGVPLNAHQLQHRLFGGVGGKPSYGFLKVFAEQGFMPCPRNCC